MVLELYLGSLVVLMIATHSLPWLGWLLTGSFIKHSTLEKMLFSSPRQFRKCPKR